MSIEGPLHLLELMGNKLGAHISFSFYSNGIGKKNCIAIATKESVLDELKPNLNTTL